jgi:hypothetical protein
MLEEKKLENITNFSKNNGKKFVFGGRFVEFGEFHI